ncbi:sensor histidine kinase [Salinicoccus albus]|uniref:sensor histidine kinase n=1 Tax=Salinicoccus albus TaxID=418756 RepID=UPI00037C400C|nr:HAMP domain-containing sensor histidine kinase [Salinicoccus albus]
MLYILIFMTIVSAYLGARLFIFKKEIKNVNRQLGQYNHFETEKKIDVNLLDRDIEALGSETNRLIDHFVKAQRDKIRSDKELKDAVANISHDLRTPLTSIKGYIQMAEAADLPEDERAEYLAIVSERAKRLEHLVNDFFELSKIDTGDYQLSPETFDLAGQVGEVLLGFYKSFKTEGLEPVVELPDRELTVTADRSAVTRVLENLIMNAVKYSDGDVKIGTEETVDAVKLYVKNSTELKDAVDPERFFDRFYIADQSRADKSTGLGLSIAKSLMEKMGGEIHAHYSPGYLTIECVWYQRGHDQIIGLRNK